MTPAEKILTRLELVDARRELARQGRVVVFTNGCFDLLHIGHARCLAEARALGDALIVGVNSDASVQELKGRGHPLVPAVERAELIGSLACVDYVTIFDETSPVALLDLLRPEIHCKGGDYAAGKPLPEAEVVSRNGGQIRILSHIEGRSTTDLIKTVIDRFAARRTVG